MIVFVTLAVRKERVEGHRFAGLHVGQAVASGHQQLAVFGNGQGPAGDSAGLEGCVHDGVKNRHPLANLRGNPIRRWGRFGSCVRGRGCHRCGTIFGLR